MRLLVCGSIIFASIPLFAASITRVGTSHELAQLNHDTDHEWLLGEKACLGAEASSCGIVVVTTQLGALLAFNTPQKEAKEGDAVMRDGAGVPTPAEMSHATQLLKDAEKKHLDEVVGFYHYLLNGEESAPLSTEIKIDDQGIGPFHFNVLGGMNTLYPSLTVQVATDNHWAFGLAGSYFYIKANDAKNRSYGGMVSANYYGKNQFEGWWAQLGAGYCHVDTGLNGGYSVAQSGYWGLATLGWRIRVKNFNIGVAAGAQSYYVLHNDIIPLDLLVVSPAGLIDLGWVF